MSGPFVIEKGVPIPKDRGVPQALRSLEVGDSFEVPLERAQYVRVYSARLKPAKFTTRKTSPTTVRIWRIA